MALDVFHDSGSSILSALTPRFVKIFGMGSLMFKYFVSTPSGPSQSGISTPSGTNRNLFSSSSFSQKGKPENMIKRIVIHPGKRSFEGTNVGLFCTILGRGTTLGNESDHLSSAMCFAGNDMSNQRITNLWSQADGKPFTMVTLRKKRVVCLMSNTLPPTLLSWSQKSQLFHWCNTETFDLHNLEEALAVQCHKAISPLSIWRFRAFAFVTCVTVITVSRCWKWIEAAEFPQLPI